MRYGHFDDERREYVIERPATPLPWINYLGTGDYVALITNTAGGYSFYRDARLRRLTRYRYNNAPLDCGGRFLYLRDAATGAFWSPTGQPVRRDLESYSCRHGLGYTVIASRYAGIAVEARYLVPLDESLEVWELILTNERDDPAQLDLFGGVEFCLWDAQDDAANFQRNFSTGEVEVEEGVIYHKTEYRERRNHFAFFACSERPAGYDTQREDFLGPYRGWENPLAVERGRVSNSLAHGWAPIGMLQVALTLAPGEGRRVAFLLGYHENPAAEKFDPPDSLRIDKRTVRPRIARCLDAAYTERAWGELRTYWETLLSTFQVQTGDIHADRMVNIWNPYQVVVALNLSRSASLFESGIGRGIGFRDSNQDLLGFVSLAPRRARERLLDLAATQLPSGGAYHQFQPLTKRGNNDIGSGFNDDPLWLVLAAAAYLKETADWGVLDELVPYDNRPELSTPLYEHLQRALSYTLDRLGPHGLPLIGRADWNDCLNLNCFSSVPGESFQTVTNKDGRVAESVVIAALFVLAAREMADLSRRRGEVEAMRGYLEAAARMEASVLEHGWDGGWFRRAYDDFGRPVGSRECVEGQIFIEPQGLAVLAGIGLADGRAEQALESVCQRLTTPHGIVLHQPAYSRYYLHLGEISSYPPGYKENAGIFCQTNPWVMIAEARVGHGDRAYDYYLRINPSAREELSDVHRCEPYVYAQMIAGRDAPTHGEAKNSWLTGTAAWSYVASGQWLLGIRPEHDGLRVDPCIPAHWAGFRARRRFRGCTYDITVRNPRHLCRGVRALLVDGRRVEGNVVPLPAEHGTTVVVEAVLEG